jgi:hypothetical protein
VSSSPSADASLAIFSVLGTGPGDSSDVGTVDVYEKVLSTFAIMS